MSPINPVNTPPQNYNIDQILQSTQPPKQPGAFRRVLGSLVGGVGNMFAPGIGGMIGNAISGGALSGSSIASMQSLPGAVASGIQGQTMQYLQLQAQMAQEQEVFETASSVMKSRHDASMAAIRNIT
jgi:outer membrane lipoprotein SlyB